VQTPRYTNGFASRNHVAISRYKNRFQLIRQNLIGILNADNQRLSELGGGGFDLLSVHTILFCLCVCL
jgi:hypothetical protein